MNLFDFTAFISTIYMIIGCFYLKFELFCLLCLIVMILQLTVFLYCYKIDLKEVV